jgi:transcriptional regulator with XRE-family HTH domain
MIKLNQSRLVEFMEFRRWNKSDLAKALNFSESAITLFLNEDRPPSRKFMDKLVQITGLTLGDLFFCQEHYKNVRADKTKIQKSNTAAQ